MGWQGNEVIIPIGMIFRKMYCAECGTKLVKHKISSIRFKGQPGFKNHIVGNYTPIGMTSKKATEYVYKCPKCNKLTTYEEQVKIHKLKKGKNAK